MVLAVVRLSQLLLEKSWQTPQNQNFDLYHRVASTTSFQRNFYHLENRLYKYLWREAYTDQFDDTERAKGDILRHD